MRMMHAFTVGAMVGLAACGSDNTGFATSGGSGAGATSGARATASSTGALSSGGGASGGGASGGGASGGATSGGATSGGATLGSTTGGAGTAAGTSSGGGLSGSSGSGTGGPSSSSGSSTGSGSTSASGSSGGASGASSGGAVTCGGITCASGDVCCTQGGCANSCVPDCRQRGCPSGLSCDSGSGVCLPSGSGSSSGGVTGGAGSGSSGGASSGGSSGGVSCGGTICASNEVCCMSGPCANSCVPNCNMNGGCPTGLTCQSSGLCVPSGGSGGSGGGPGGGPGGGSSGGGPGGGSSGGGSSGGGPGGSSGGSSSSGGGSSGGSLACWGLLWGDGGIAGNACTSSADCSAPTLACDTSQGVCVGCLIDDDCPAGEDCDAASESCNPTSSCSLAANAYPTTSQIPAGCRVLERDACSCEAARIAAGVPAPFLKFSCNVDITVTRLNGTTVVQLTSTDQPDRHDKYYGNGNACYESDGTPTYPDPYDIVPQGIVMNIPESVTTDGGSAVPGGIMGLAVDGTAIFNDSAGATKSIWTEEGSFTRCHGHPNSSGVYHYHMEPYSITQDDDSLVGVMRDGYLVYGRKDPDGTEAGDPDGGVSGPYFGHWGYTVDSPAVKVFHYHVHYEAFDGGEGYFVAPNTFYGTMAPCTNTNDGGTSHC